MKSKRNPRTPFSEPLNPNTNHFSSSPTTKMQDTSFGQNTSFEPFQVDITSTTTTVTPAETTFTSTPTTVSFQSSGPAASAVPHIPPAPTDNNSLLYGSLKNLDATKEPIARAVLQLYEGKASSDYLLYYADNCVMHSPLARCVDKQGIKAAFSTLPKTFSVWNIVTYKVDGGEDPRKIHMELVIRYRWKIASKKDKIFSSYITLTLNEYGMILHHDENWADGPFGLESTSTGSKGAKGKAQLLVQEAGGLAFNFIGQAKRWNSKLRNKS